MIKWLVDAANESCHSSIDVDTFRVLRACFKRVETDSFMSMRFMCARMRPSSATISRSHFAVGLASGVEATASSGLRQSPAQ